MMGDFYFQPGDETGHAICIFIEVNCMDALRCMVFGHAPRGSADCRPFENGVEQERCIPAFPV
jgi:hypothetical protein